MTEDLSNYNKEGTILRQAQNRLLEILLEIDRICRKHNIPYFINGGNALGAVRHGGFIPWDDDIDINLKREDYLKLIKIIEKELPNRFVLQNRQNEKYLQMAYSRVVDKDSLCEVEKDKGSYRKHIKHKGLFLDIFFIERGNKKVKKIVDFFYYRIIYNLTPASSKAKRIIANIGFPFLSLFVYIIRKFNFIFNKNNYVFGYGIYFKEEFRLDEIYPVKPITFEGKVVSGPHNIHAYLKRYFGDYMRIPPIEQRKTHAERIVVYEKDLHST